MNTYAEICDFVTSADPSLERVDDVFHIAALLLSSLQHGTDPFTLATFTGENVQWVSSIGSRWLANDVWTDDGYVMFDPDGPDADITFWILVAIGQGMIESAVFMEPDPLAVSPLLLSADEVT